jgi:hypothetical protein
MVNKAICIHGHFYQPPREDPISGHIPKEPGAAPYNNWNERILAECYRPNAELNNFELLSFNIGPTLTSWLHHHDPDTIHRIIAQDHANNARYGVGNALAQAYNHTILPLATTADKVIQIYWGIVDFEHRFGRKPKGMWLPETAVDYETLAILANHGIQFIILAPWQADVETLDPTEPYLIQLPTGGFITAFFYHRELSGLVSFDPIATSNADLFASRDLTHSYRPEKTQRGEPQILVIASDGELYGHHQPHREHFLAHLLNGASAQTGIKPTFPALWLKEFPPIKVIKIQEKTSWSCHHGVSRWFSECGCSSLDSKWKSNLRKSLDRLAIELDALYFDSVYPLISKPRVLRQRYIYAMLGRLKSEELIREMANYSLTSEATFRIQLLLESQRERQRMFTSCGWFYDDFDRIEPRNNLAYAAQAVRLARIATGDDLSTPVVEDFKKVISPRTGVRADTIFSNYLQRTWTLSNFEMG